MNRLVLIGNGFDLAHGLKTRYTDFIFWYLKECLEKSFETNSYNDALLKIKYNRTYYNRPKFESLVEIRKFIRPRNITSEFFVGRTKYEDIDIEFKNDNIYNIITPCFENSWYDIEKLYFDNLREIFSKNQSRRNELINEFHSGFAFLIERLKEYMEVADRKNDPIEKAYMELIRMTLEKVDNYNFSEEKRLFFSRTQNYYPKSILLLSFNYTSTAYRYEKEDRTKRIVVSYIHGNYKNEIIFGFGDERGKLYQEIEDLDNNEFLRFTKSFQYLNDDRYRKLINFINSDAYEIFVMGHSCGLSDRTLLNSIFEHRNCQLIKIFYHKNEQTERDNYTEITQNISRHFKDKAFMRKIIFPKHKDYIMPQINHSE